MNPQIPLYRRRFAAPWLLTLLFFGSAVHAQSGSERALRFEQASQQTREVAERYFQSYLALDWDRLAPMLADEASFADPTAALVFGGVVREGKAAVLKTFREGYSTIEQMRFVPHQTFFSGRFAVFSGQLDWTMKIDNGRRVHTVMPLVTTLRIEGGLVLEHRDLADYHPFLVALRQAREPGTN